MAKTNYDLTFKIGVKADRAELSSLQKSLEQAVREGQKIGEKTSESMDKAVKSANQILNILKNSETDFGTMSLNKFNKSLKQSKIDIQSLKSGFEQLGPGGAASFNSLQRNLLKADVQISKTNKTLDNLAKSFKNTVSWGISSTVFNSLSNSLAGAYGYVQDLDRSLNDVRIVTGQSADEMTRFAKEANAAAKRLGTSTTAFTDAALIYYQQGDSDAVAKAKAEVTLKTANVTGQSASEVSEQLTAVWNGYKVSAEESELYIDKLAAVATATASDLEELSTGMGKVASAANVMGVDVDQLNATLATVVSVTRQAPESVGTAFKTIYARMGDIQAGLDQETTLGNYTQKMEQFGFSVLDGKGNLKDMGDVIEEVGSNWQNLTKEQRINLAQTMAGKRQYNNLISLFDNWDMYTKAINTSVNATGTLQEQQEIYMESVEASLAKLRSRWEGLYDTIFDEDLIKGFSGLLGNLVESFDKIAGSMGGGLGALTGIGAIGASVFSKQIGSMYSDHKQNVLGRERNSVSLENKKKQLEKGYSSNEKMSIQQKAERENLKIQLEYNERLMGFQESLSEEAYKEHIQNQEKVGILKEQAEMLKLQNEEVMKRVIMSEKQSVYEEGVFSAEKAEALIDENKQDIAKIKEKIENQKRYLKVVEKIKEIEDKDKAGKKLSDKDIAYYGTLINEKEDLEGKEGKKGAEGVEGTSIFIMEEDIACNERLVEVREANIASTREAILIDQKQKKVLNELTNEMGSLEVAYKTLEDAKEHIDNFKILSGAISSVTSSISLLFSVINIWKDEDATVGEKTVQTLMTASLLLPAIVKGVKDMVAAQSALNAKKLVELATKAKNNKLTAQEIILQKKLINLQKESGKASTTAVVAAQGFKNSLNELGNSAKGVITKLGPWGLAIAGIIAAVGVAAYTFHREATKEERALEKISEAAKEAEETNKKLAESYDTLNSSIKDIDGQISGIEKMTVGSLEWKRAVFELNGEVDQLIKKYPQLASAFERDGNGVFQINEEKVNEVLEDRFKLLEQSRNINNRIAIEKQEAANAIERRDLKNEEARLKTSVLNKQGLVDSAKSIKQGMERENSSPDGSGKAMPTKKYSDQQMEQAQASIDEANKSLKKAQKDLKEFGKEKNRVEQENTLAIRELTSKLGRDLLDGTTLTESEKKVTAETVGEKYEQQVNKKIDDLGDGGVKAGETDDHIQKVIDNKEIQDLLGLGEGARQLKEAGFGHSLKYKDKDGQDQERTREEVLRAIAEYEVNKTFDAEGIAREDLSKYDVYETQREMAIDIESGDASKKYSQKELEDFKEDFGTEGPISGKKIDQAKDQAKTGNEFKKLDAENFEHEISARASKAELDPQRYEAYVRELEKDNELLEDNDDLTLDAADAHLKFDRELANCSEIIGDNLESLQDWQKGLDDSPETLEMVGKIVNELQGTLGEEFDYDFLRGNLSEVIAMIEGDEGALESIQKKLAAKQLLKIDGKGEDFEKDIADLIGKVNAMDLGEIEIGTSINDTPFYNSLREMYKNGYLTAGQINSLLNGMGFEDVEVVTITGKNQLEERKDGNYEYVDPVTKEKHSIPLKSISRLDEGHSITIPLFSKKNPIKFKGLTTPAGLNNRTIGGGGKGGGSTAKPKKVEKTTDEKKDVYHDVNIELEQIATSLERANDASEKLFGAELVANYNEQFSLLQKNIETTEEKLKIAAGEQARLRAELSRYGVGFEADGSISNYFSAFDAQLAALNAVEDRYNSLSAQGQEGYQGTYDQAKENFEEFLENMEEYDSNLTDLIPGLEDKIQADIDAQFDKQEEIFKQEIEIRLDMSEAMKDWNEFEAEVIKGFKDEDILGLAQYKLKDFSSFFNADEDGSIQIATKFANKVQEELKKMQNGEESYIYGDDQAKALEDLKEYYDELMKQMSDFKKMYEDVQESFIDMLNQTSEKFGEQISEYSTVTDLLKHDMDLINMLYGEESYGMLSEYYEKQEENNNKQLDFHKQQVAFWKEIMASEEEGSEAWESARENWLSSVGELNSAIQASIQNLQEKYLNTINEIFENLNNKVTNGLGLDYANQEWELMNQNADRYLDDINSIYEIQSLANKYQKSIDEMSSASAQNRLNELMEQELTMLKEKDELSKYDIERANLKYEIALKQIALEEAQQSKNTMRLKRDSQGNYSYQYVADEDKISGLQQEMSELYNQLYNMDKDAYQGNLDELYGVWAEFQEKMKEAAQINDPQERAERELLLQQQYGELINGIVADNESIKANINTSAMSHLFDLYSQNADNYELMTQEQKNILSQFVDAEEMIQNTAYNNLFGLYDRNLESFNLMTQEQKDILMSSLVPTWESAYQTMADKIVGEGGFEETVKGSLEEIKNATEDYNNSLKELQESAGEAFDRLESGTSEAVDATQNLIDNNSELMDSYKDQVEQVGAVVSELEKLVKQYEASGEAAKKAAEEAYKYWLAVENKNADEVEDQVLESDKPSTPEKPKEATAAQEPARPSLNIGSRVEIKAGARWYADSYGGGASGPAYGGNITYTNAYGSHPYNIGGAGWVRKSDIVGYDTGGYTGSWGTDGKMAFLHQKELVLNAGDTQNMLDTVSIVRNLMSRIGSKTGSFSSKGLAKTFGEKESLDQNVTISAEFPNVKDAREIEDALNNLVNQAAQQINT